MNEADAEKTLAVLTDLATSDERQGLPSAHSWRRNELCHGSHQLSQEARRLGQEAYSAPSEASASGDRIHGALAKEKVELYPSEAETAHLLRERAAEQVRRIFGEQKIEEYREERYWLRLEGRPVASGRVDYLVMAQDTALIIDFKTGFSEPDPARINAQLKFLAVTVGAHFRALRTIYVQIISGPFGVSEHCYSMSELRDAWDSVVATLDAINNPRAGFSPSQEACRYCPASNICVALQKQLLPVAKLQMKELPTEGQAAAKLLERAALVETYLAEIRSFYTRWIADGHSVPGWDLVPGAPKRAVSDWPAARAKLAEFIDQEQLDALAVFSIPAVEKLLGAAIGVKGGKLKEELARVLGNLLELKYPEPSLKPIKDEHSTHPA